MRSSGKPVVAVGVIVALLAIPAFFVSSSQSVSGGDWTSLTFDNQNSRYQSSSTVTSVNLNQLAHRWTFSTSGTVYSTPVVLNGNVYFADMSWYVYSVKLSTGALNWKVKMGAAVSSTLCLANGLVYVGVGLGKTQVEALSQSNGALVWSTSLNATLNALYASPIVSNGILYIGVAAGPGETESSSGQHGDVYALNANTGALIWTFDTMIGNSGGAGVWGSVAVDASLNSIYFGTGNSFVDSDSSLYSSSILSLNAQTGALNWAYQAYSNLNVGGDQDFGSTPNLFTVVIGGVTHSAVGLGGKDGNYYVLDRISGVLLEKLAIGTGAPDNGVIGLAGFYYPSGTANPMLFIPSSYNVPHRGCCGEVVAVSTSTKSIAWRFITPGAMKGSVTVVPGAVLFGDENGNLCGVSIATGSLLFSARLPGAINSGVTVAEGYVIASYGFGVSGTNGVVAYSAH